jgi:hypothetical protein
VIPRTADHIERARHHEARSRHHDRLMIEHGRIVLAATVVAAETAPFFGRRNWAQLRLGRGLAEDWHRAEHGISPSRLRED